MEYVTRNGLKYSIRKDDARLKKHCQSHIRNNIQYLV